MALTAISTQLLFPPIKAQFPSTDESYWEGSVPAGEEQAEMSGERLIEN